MVDAPERQSVIMGFPSRTHRWSAASGIGFVVLIVASALVLGFDYPTYDDSPRDFTSYYAKNSDEIQLSVLLGALAAFSLIWFFGFLRWVFATQEMATRGFVRATSIAFGGGIAGVAIAMVSGIAQETAVVAHGNIDPGVIRALDLMADYSLVHAELVFSVFLLSAYFIIRVTKVLPQWLSWTAMVGTGLGVAQSAILLAPQDDDGLLGILGLVWFAVFLVWMLGASITLVRRV
jgi:hypothetical protein